MNLRRSAVTYLSPSLEASRLGKAGDARVCAIGGARLDKCCSRPSASLSIGAEPTGPQDAGGDFPSKFVMGMSLAGIAR